MGRKKSLRNWIPGEKKTKRDLKKIVLQTLGNIWCNSERKQNPCAKGSCPEDEGPPIWTNEKE